MTSKITLSLLIAAYIGITTYALVATRSHRDGGHRVLAILSLAR